MAMRSGFEAFTATPDPAQLQAISGAFVDAHEEDIRLAVASALRSAQAAAPSKKGPSPNAIKPGRCQ